MHEAAFASARRLLFLGRTRLAKVGIELAETVRKFKKKEQGNGERARPACPDKYTHSDLRSDEITR